MSNESNIDDDIAQLQAKFQQKKLAQLGDQSPLSTQENFYQQGFGGMGNQNGDSSMDDLLEQVKAQFHDQKSQSPSASSNQASGMEMDDLLEQVRAEFEQPQTSEPSSSNSKLNNSTSSLEDFLTQVRDEFQHKQHKRVSQSKSRQNQSSEEDLFSEIKSNFEVKQSAQVNKSYEQTIDDVRHEEQQRQRQEKALRTQAQKWLKTLSPHSDEGIWFEEFAYSYPSRLEAAMDYLQALGEI